MITQKRVMTIQDISCVGRCSITVALPILSAAGIETAILPTAILSTHTGDFTGFTFRDLTEDIQPVADHWKTLDLEFDALYSGFLGSAEQIDTIRRIFREFKKEKTLILVDPAMADAGKPYKTYTPEMVRRTAELCTMADIIVPNQTEAALLLGEEYKGDVKSKEETEALLRKLAALGPKVVVLTGVSFSESELGAAAYDREKDEFSYAFSPRAKGFFHGTGDVFASAFLASYLRKPDLQTALETATGFVYDCVTETIRQGRETRYGVCFELLIPRLLEYLPE
ncbi:MAG: pyridoxamine kinase [Clostridiales bacterium]|nr:pyridoxamine kinase [Clostridiales bacterium]